MLNIIMMKMVMKLTAMMTSMKSVMMNGNGEKKIVEGPGPIVSTIKTVVKMRTIMMSVKTAVEMRQIKTVV